MAWTVLKKGATSLHITYGATFTNNLYAYNFRMRTAPSIELSFDLNPNLRTRSKETNTYIDARDLADGDIAQLKLVQLDSEGFMHRLSSRLATAGTVSDDWKLTIELNGLHTF